MMQFVRRIHFIGVGGVGMSGIARVLSNLGYAVSGSDLKATELTRALARDGVRVFSGHRASNVRGAQVVVVSSAVPRENPEVRAARARGVPVVARAEMLAELARLKKTVTVSGTHGKTTTTAMISVALRAAGADPTMVVGGQIANIGANARLGLGEHLVAEADESDGSFLLLHPLVAVVTNIDDDHLEHYGSMARLKEAFLRHIGSVPFYGTAVLCADDPVVRSLLPRVQRPYVTYGLTGRPPSGSPYAPRTAGRGRVQPHWLGKLLPGRGLPRMAVHRGGRKVGVLELGVPGRHNALNALAAAAACGFLGMDLRKVLRGLSEFRGVGRRQERLGEAAGVTFYDDYGHHPTEIRATVSALRDLFPKRRLVTVFQPHRYSRTQALWRAFGPALAAAGEVHVAPVYAAGEKPIPGVGSELIVDSVRRAGGRAQPFTRAVDLVRELREGDVVLTLGAGDIWKVGMDLLRRLGGRLLAAY